MKAYSTKSNCKRAALAHFGKDAVEGADFRIYGTEVGYLFEAIKAKAKPVEAPKPAEKREALLPPVVPTVAEKRREGAIKDAMAQASSDDKDARRAGVAKLKRLGVEPPTQAEPAPKAKAAKPAPAANGETKAPRDGTKQAAAVALLQRKSGATVAQIAEVTGWLPHTTRAFISVAVKRKLGLGVTTEKTGEGTVYYAQAAG
jgi:hypothetical protein